MNRKWVSGGASTLLLLVFVIATMTSSTEMSHENGFRTEAGALQRR